MCLFLYYLYICCTYIYLLTIFSCIKSFSIHMEIKTFALPPPLITGEMILICDTNLFTAILDSSSSAITGYFHRILSSTIPLMKNILSQVAHSIFITKIVWNPNSTKKMFLKSDKFGYRMAVSCSEINFHREQIRNSWNKELLWFLLSPQCLGVGRYEYKISFHDMIFLLPSLSCPSFFNLPPLYLSLFLV